MGSKYINSNNPFLPVKRAGLRTRARFYGSTGCYRFEKNGNALFKVLLVKCLVAIIFEKNFSISHALTLEFRLMLTFYSRIFKSHFFTFKLLKMGSNML